jgi:hypothetical protein
VASCGGIAQLSSPGIVSVIPTLIIVYICNRMEVFGLEHLLEAIIVQTSPFGELVLLMARASRGGTPRMGC